MHFLRNDLSYYIVPWSTAKQDITLEKATVRLPFNIAQAVAHHFQFQDVSGSNNAQSDRKEEHF